MKNLMGDLDYMLLTLSLMKISRCYIRKIISFGIPLEFKEKVKYNIILYSYNRN